MSSLKRILQNSLLVFASCMISGLIIFLVDYSLPYNGKNYLKNWISKIDLKLYHSPMKLVEDKSYIIKNIKEESFTSISIFPENKGDKFVYKRYYDEKGFFVTKHERDSTKDALVLMGGSYVFGQDLEYKDILESQVNENTQKFNMYTIAKGAWGFHQVLHKLYLLKEDSFVGENRTFIYFLMVDHPKRSSGSILSTCCQPWGAIFKRNDDGFLKYYGQFERDVDLASFLKLWFMNSNLAYRFNLFGFLDKDQITNYEQEVSCNILSEMNYIIKNKFQGNLKVVNHPQAPINNSKYFFECLRKNNVSVLNSISEEFNLKVKESNINPITKYSIHPSGQANKILSEILIEKIDR